MSLRKFYYVSYIVWIWGALVVKKLFANSGVARDSSLIPKLETSAGGEHGNILLYPYLENPMERGAWQAAVIGEQRVRHN